MSEKYPWLDLWQRGEGIFGALAGLRVEILPIENAPPEGPHLRMYVSPRTQGLGRDTARPTGVTPKGWAAARQRQQCAKQVLAAIGQQAPYYQDELGLEPDE